MEDVLFDLNGEQVAVSEAEARIVGEKLIGFAAGKYEEDVALLASHGLGPEWREGARALGQVIEATLTTARSGPIPIDPSGKAADALYALLALPGPSSWDATSGQARLRDAIERRRP